MSGHSSVVRGTASVYIFVRFPHQQSRKWIGEVRNSRRKEGQGGCGPGDRRRSRGKTMPVRMEKRGIYKAWWRNNVVRTWWPLGIGGWQRGRLQYHWMTWHLVTCNPQPCGVNTKLMTNSRWPKLARVGLQMTKPKSKITIIDVKSQLITYDRGLHITETNVVFCLYSQTLKVKSGFHISQFLFVRFLAIPQTLHTPHAT